MNKDQHTPIIIIYGATGTGKTEFAEKLANKVGGSIVNMDLGQLYSKFSIGTAKPNWKKSTIEQYLFDIIDDKKSFSAVEYRKQVASVINSLSQKKKPILIVGGTGFYMYNLLFANKIEEPQEITPHSDAHNDSWDALNFVDPIRAQAIHPNDSYRIKRALSIFRKTNRLPSECGPMFDPVFSNIVILNIERETEDLKKRIHQRIDSFFEAGWLQEVKRLIDEGWTDFLLKKKIIGYPSLITMAQRGLSNDQVKQEIAQITMRYIKKQRTFWNGFLKKISAIQLKKNRLLVDRVNLTFTELDLYLNLFLKKYFSYE